LNRNIILLLLLVTIIFLPNGIEKSFSSEIPPWINNIISWFNDDLISELELRNALDYLDKRNVISLSSDEIQNKLPESLIKIEKKYEIMETKGVKHLVDLNKIKSSVPKDGIPSIDNPKFVSADKADFILDHELVIGVNLNGVIKAYPLFILNWHEIVNDFFSETPVAITYCPLCFTNQVFERTINGQTTEIGVSGKLYNSNLVMYDRLTESYWSQALGLAIKGELTGTQLKRLPFDVLMWKDWRTLYPETEILTTDTGHQRPYGSNPYADYFKDPRILFPIENKDERIPLKEVILGFEDNNIYKAYRLQDVESKKVINDRVGNKDVLIISTISFMGRAFDRNLEGQTLEFEFQDGKILDKQTESEWNLEGIAISGDFNGKQLKRIVYDPGFWFEWAAFHPDTELYGT
jgi:hypothetical protein